MEHKICIVGIGPGTPDFILPIARRRAEEAEVLIGGQRALDLFKELPKETLVIKASLAPLVDYIKANRRRKIAVLVSGDPGFYSMLSYLKGHFTPGDLEVIPGISSVQMAFARLKEPWQETRLASLHGRDLELLDQLFKDKPLRLALLTDNLNSPRNVANYLSGRGFPIKRVVICQNLGYQDEIILESSLENLLTNENDYPNCVMVIENEWN